MRRLVGINVSKAKIDVLYLKDVAAIKASIKVVVNDRERYAELINR